VEQAIGRILTFYSYKGGTGRSMALANVAWMLAANGARVLAVDWDLEAPGLHRYFRPFLIDPDLFETDGLIETFWGLAAGVFAAEPSFEQNVNEPEASPVLKAVSEEVIYDALEDAVLRLDWKFPTDGFIDFIGAGRQNATYGKRVNTFDWKRFYEIGGAAMLQSAKVYMRTNYDYVLIDSRTGVSDTSGICTLQMPDTLVACFTLNRQSIDGVAAILRSIRNYQSATVKGVAINLFPVAMRIEFSEHERLEIARGYARAAFSRFLPAETQDSARDYWDDMEIAYRPYYAYEEVLAAFGDATGAAGAASTLLSQTENLARRVSGNMSLRAPEMLEADRARILAKYAFKPETVAASRKPPYSTVKVEPEDTQFLRSVYSKGQKWQISQYDYRYLLNGRELELLTDADRATFGRQMSFYYTNSTKLGLFRQELYQSLLKAYAVIGVIAAVLFGALGVFKFNLYDLLHYGLDLAPVFALLTIFSAIALFIFVVLSLFALALFNSPNRPYGLSIKAVLRLLILPVFRETN
jgi:cellulose biosynthesis protein BcsQ